MRCLVVVAHPLADSLCRHLAARVARKLAEDGHAVVEEDLYGQDFDPRLSPAERASYYRTYDSSAVAGEVARLREAEALVLLFPTWWFGFPAILKGWFDRVWGPGIAYDHADDLGPITPRLDTLRHVLAVTTLGAPWWVDRLVLRQPVRRVLKVALLGACARNARLRFLSLHDSEKATPARVEAFAGKVIRELDRWPRGGALTPRS